MRHAPAARARASTPWERRVMKLYADAAPRRTRQVLGDALFVAWLLLWLWLANVVHDATLALATPGRRIETAGGDLSHKLRAAGSAVGDLPLVGDQVRSPFDGAGRAADQIAAAGTSQVEAVQHLAFWLGVAVAGIPVLLLVVLYLPRRCGRGATATRPSYAHWRCWSSRRRVSHRRPRLPVRPVGNAPG